MPQSESTTGYCLSTLCRVLSRADGSCCGELCFRSEQESPFCKFSVFQGLADEVQPTGGRGPPDAEA